MSDILQANTNGNGNTGDKIRIALMERDVSQLTLLFAKFELTTDKLNEISSALKQMLVLQELRVASIEKNIDKTDDRVHQHEKLDSVHHELIEEKLEKLTSLTYNISKDQIDRKEEFKSALKKYDLMESRIVKLEKWRWTLSGAMLGIGAVIGLVVGKLDIAHVISFI